MRRDEDAAIRRMSRACDDLAKLRRSGMLDEDASERPLAVLKSEETNLKSEECDHKSEKTNPKSEHASGDGPVTTLTRRMQPSVRRGA